ncbi:MAG: hypothetical protein OXL68_04010 [Paracoccaceae bacterium]|nr:hypothetical protein [Paracoccaceae bacterium]
MTRRREAFACVQVTSRRATAAIRAPSRAARCFPNGRTTRLKTTTPHPPTGRRLSQRSSHV